MTNQCEHGQLARVCELCEKDAEIAALRAELAQAMKERARAIAVGDDMEQEVERLRAENDTLRGAMAANDERLRVAGERVGIIAGCDTAELMADEIECLLAEVAGLREDAERYRWLRDNSCPQVMHPSGYGMGNARGEALDAAIDAARKGTT